MRNLITKLLFAFLLPLFFVACDDEDSDMSSSCSVVIDGKPCKILSKISGHDLHNKFFYPTEDWETGYNGRDIYWGYCFYVVNSNDDMFEFTIDVSESVLKSGLQLTATNSDLYIDAFDYEDEYQLLLSDGNVRVSSHSPKKSSVRFDNAVFSDGSHIIKMNGSVAFENDSLYDYID